MALRATLLRSLGKDTHGVNESRSTGVPGPIGYNGSPLSASANHAGAGARSTRPLRTGREKWAIGLWLFQVLGTVATLIAALVEVETIIATFPVLSLLGLSLALIARPLHSWLVVAFGLSAPLVCALCAASIAVFDWGPRSAQDPIARILQVYGLVTVPLAAGAFLRIETRGWHPQGTARDWRYSLRSMLLLMTALCVVFVLIRIVVLSATGASFGFGLFSLVAIGFSALVLSFFLSDPAPPATKLVKLRVSAEAVRLLASIRASGPYASDADAILAALRLLDQVEDAEQDRSAAANGDRNPTEGLPAEKIPRKGN